MNDFVSLAEKKTGIPLNEAEPAMASILLFNLPQPCAGYLPLYNQKIYHEGPILDRLKINAAGKIRPERFSPCEKLPKVTSGGREGNYEVFFFLES
jgi:hypothetical protein